MPEIPLIKRVATLGRAWVTLTTRAQEARDAGATGDQLARALKLTPEQYDSLARILWPNEAAETSSSPIPAPVATPAPPVPRFSVLQTIPTGAALTDGDAVTSRTLNRYRTQRSAWVDFDTRQGMDDSGAPFRLGRATAADLLSALPEGVDRVYVMGASNAMLSGNVRHFPTMAEEVRAWFRAPTPGWNPEGHYLADPKSPVGKWRNAVTGHVVTVYRAAAWFGENLAEELTVSDARTVMAWLNMQMANVVLPGNDRRPSGAQWLATPATTGRDLMLRLMPPSAAYPVLSPELRDLIKATSGQGRSELLPPTGTDDAVILPGFCYLDGRMMYGGLTWGMPDGNTRLWTEQQIRALNETETARVVKGRSRWRVSYTVPQDWDHVGLLMTPDSGGGWSWPSMPGQQGATWAGGSEVALALTRGWKVDIHEGMSWGESKGLNFWTEVLNRMHAGAAESLGRDILDAEHREQLVSAARAAVRFILLTGIGALAPKSRKVTKSTLNAQDVPGGARQVDGVWEWEEDEPMTAWALATARHEWAATVWERSRVRLMHGPTGATEASGRRIYAGALHLQRSEVLAFRTDAIYTTRDPGWPDDGAAGRFRVKGQLKVPVKRPTTYPELFALRDRAEHSS